MVDTGFIYSSQAKYAYHAQYRAFFSHLSGTTCS